MSYNLSLISDPQSFREMKAEWNNLVAQSPSLCNSIFFTHEWFECWWNTIGHNKNLLIFVVKDIHDDIVGIVPLMRYKDKIRGFHAQKISFIGNIYWSRSDFLIKPGHEEVLDVILSALLRNHMPWDLLDIRNIPVESPNYVRFKTSLMKYCVPYLEAETLRSPFIPIHTHWDDFFQRRSSNFRQNLRNKMSRIQKSNRVVGLRQYNQPDQISEVFPLLFKIGEKSWKHKIQNSICTPENSDFYFNLFKTFTPKGQCRVFILTFDGQPVAFEYHLQYQNTAYALRAEYDEEFKPLSPGSVLEFMMKTIL